jgi:hypothetical protein
MFLFRVIEQSISVKIMNSIVFPSLFITGNNKIGCWKPEAVLTLFYSSQGSTALAVLRHYQLKIVVSNIPYNLLPVS